MAYIFLIIRHKQLNYVHQIEVFLHKLNAKHKLYINKLCCLFYETKAIKTTGVTTLCTTSATAIK